MCELASKELKILLAAWRSHVLRMAEADEEEGAIFMMKAAEFSQEYNKQ